jgi:hypothetical protein
LYRQGKDNEGNNRDENENRRGSEGYRSVGLYKEYNSRVFNNSYKELLQRLAEVSSEEASLNFRLYRLKGRA